MINNRNRNILNTERFTWRNIFLFIVIGPFKIISSLFLYIYKQIAIYNSPERKLERKLHMLKTQELRLVNSIQPTDIKGIEKTNLKNVFENSKKFGPLNGKVKEMVITEFENTKQLCNVTQTILACNSESLMVYRINSVDFIKNDFTTMINSIANSEKVFDTRMSEINYNLVDFQKTIDTLEKSEAFQTSTAVGTAVGITAGIAIATVLPKTAMATKIALGAKFVPGVGWVIAGVVLARGALLSHKNNRETAIAVMEDVKIYNVEINNLRIISKKIEDIFLRTKSLYDNIHKDFKQIEKFTTYVYTDMSQDEQTFLHKMVNNVHSLSKLLSEEVQISE